jgi:predicted acylesterase/phospholipase RssA
MPEQSEKKNYQSPEKECDLVMEGGITSGIVYPPAVLELAEKFRFRSIGGASAGAIAAALTAAAELGRKKEGFENLNKKFKELTTGDFILKLFKSPPETQPLLDFITEVFLSPPDKKTQGNHWCAWLAWFWKAFQLTQTKLAKETSWGWTIGALLGLIPALFFGINWASDGHSLSLIGAFGGVVMGLFVFPSIGRLIWVLVYAVNVFWRYVPKDGYFGLCKGFEKDNPKTLTTWLHDAIQELSGHKGKKPLTFRDLSLSDSKIQLRMVTTNLSHNQPYVLPFKEERFIFCESEMMKFFPPDVVEHMKDKKANEELPEGFYYLATGDALPVIVATRLSLSFPILLSAIKLYTLNGQATQKNKDKFEASDLQANWFSDGGISSNFPIHFFDAWLPQRPTFGIDLTDSPEKESERFSAINSHAQSQNIGDVHLPTTTEEVLPRWSEVKTLPAFGAAIFNTARNYRDAMQSRLPSYRERIIQIQLNANEGGLNLAMPETTMQTIAAKGKLAGECLQHQYSQGTGFREHQWVRFRVLMHYLEASLFEMKATFTTPQHFEALFQEQLQHQGNNPWYAPENSLWCKTAEARMTALLDLLDQWEKVHGGKVFFSKHPIKPEASLRVTPPI